jgi:hypothetical protein
MSRFCDFFLKFFLSIEKIMTYKTFIASGSGFKRFIPYGFHPKK